MAVSSLRILVAVATALTAGCTFMPMAVPQARELTKVLPGSLSARQNKVGIGIAFGSTFRTQATGYQATDVAKVELYVIPTIHPGNDPNDAVFAGESTWNPARVAAAGDVAVNWDGSVNGYTFNNLPAGTYYVLGAALNAANENITQGLHASSMNSGGNTTLTVSPTGAVSYAPNPAQGFVDVVLPLLDAPTSQAYTGIRFTPGDDSATSGQDNWPPI